MERRAHYRVASDDVPRVQAAVRTSRGAVIAGEPANVSVDGAALRFAVSELGVTGGPVFEIGEQVELLFGVPARDKPVLVTATVIHRTEQDGARQYGFQFADRSKLESQLAPALYRLFNRRASDRVKPAPESPIDVTVELSASAAPVTAQLLDISTGGMGLRVPLAAEPALAPADRVRVLLALPTHQARLDLVVRIRNRCLIQSGVRYGGAYDLAQTRNAQHQLNAVALFVLDRQQARDRSHTLRSITRAEESASLD
jgi:hypothetical protein